MTLWEVTTLPDTAHLLPRCPKCGYGLRSVRGYWWCDVCKTSIVPQKGPSLREIFRAAGADLRRFLFPKPARRSAISRPRTAITPAERASAMMRCSACGALTPRGLLPCVHCGASFGRPTELPPPQVIVHTQPSRADGLVYRYIVDNGGEISLSKASVDLGLSISELQASIRRLESSGSLMRDRPRDTGGTDS